MIPLVDKRVIGIIMFRCNDSDSSDFPMSFYTEAYIYAARQIARKYSLLKRSYSFNCKIDLDENADDYTEKLAEALATPVKLKIQSFDKEISVTVNDEPYSQGNDLVKLKESDDEYEDSDEDTIKEYILYYDSNSYMFNYTGRSKDDSVSIVYSADITVDDFDDESVTPVLPPGYDTELIKYALLYIAEAGIPKFTGAKKEKYKEIYQLNMNKNIEQVKDGEKVPWPTIKVFKVI